MTAINNPADLRKRGLEILIRELGFVDAMRFMLQFESGRGDYAAERSAMFLPLSDNEFLREARRRVDGPRQSS